ncbi:MAG: YbhB/YbcL family Raf kinase inhibitor-like protein [Terriglobales bacterium]
MKIQIGSLMLLVLSLSVHVAAQGAGKHAARADSQQPFQLSSTTFTNGATLPLSMINNNIVNGVNACSLDGSPGGNESPELSWTGAPAGTASFVVTTYDSTAAFTHWGMYNIPSTATGLPENAGIAGSPYGSQIVNDFFVGAEYDGPCPPAGYRPYAHHYVFTVYALDITLRLQSSPNFPASAETLYQALIRAGKARHILRSSSIFGMYSTTPTAK